jgi:hypothetical protein
MKNTIARTLVTLGISAFLSPVALLAQPQINATIPFDFTVGSKSFPAGDYSVKQVNEYVLLIQSITDGTGVMTMTIPSEKTQKSDGTPVLVFNRYGDSYFLSKVSGEDRGWKLHQSPVEKEMVAKVPTPKPVIVAAALHSK